MTVKARAERYLRHADKTARGNTHVIVSPGIARKPFFKRSAARDRHRLRRYDHDRVHHDLAAAA